MSRLADRFGQLRRDGCAALIPYITAGDPRPDATVDLMHTLVAAGADVLEIGVPFSDPMADGPVIQTACERALAHGTSLSDVLGMVGRFRETDADTPVVLMGYLNPVDALGLDTFGQRAREAGVDGALIVDLTAEEAPDVLPTLTAHGIDPVCLIAPTTGGERMRRICAHASGFIYYVSFKGVTGANRLDVGELETQVGRLREHTDLPVAVGFGVSTPEIAAAVARVADAVVVGSALVRQIGELGEDRVLMHSAVGDTLAAMRAAIDEKATTRETGA